MRVSLVNFFHAGDIILCRSLIRRVRPLLIDRVALELQCKPQYRYLWDDLGLPLHGVETPIRRDDEHHIDMWFGHGGDLLGVSGLSHATHVTSYNRQAEPLGLPLLDPQGEVPDIAFAQGPNPTDVAGVLVENGPVLSGQQTQDLAPFIGFLADSFRGTVFYCTAPPSRGCPSNVVDVSRRNLIEISALSTICKAMVARLSGPFVSTLVDVNRGRLPRLVLGKPIGCPIYDESDVRYCDTYDQLELQLREILVG